MAKRLPRSSDRQPFFSTFTCLVPVYNTLTTEGESVPVQPTDDTAPVLVVELGRELMLWSQAEKYAKDLGLEPTIVYWYVGDVLKSDSDELEESLQRAQETQARLDQVQYVEVPKVSVEFVKDYWFTLVVSFAAAIGLNVVVWLNVLLQKLDR